MNLKGEFERELDRIFLIRLAEEAKLAEAKRAADEAEAAR
jgi:hypothetical protein